MTVVSLLSVRRNGALAAGTADGRLRPERIRPSVARDLITGCLRPAGLAEPGFEALLVTTGESGGIGDVTSVNVAPA